MNHPSPAQAKERRELRPLRPDLAPEQRATAEKVRALYERLGFINQDEFAQATGRIRREELTQIMNGRARRASLRLLEAMANASRAPIELVRRYFSEELTLDEFDQARLTGAPTGDDLAAGDDPTLQAFFYRIERAGDFKDAAFRRELKVSETKTLLRLFEDRLLRTYADVEGRPDWDKVIDDLRAHRLTAGPSSEAITGAEAMALAEAEEEAELGGPVPKKFQIPERRSSKRGR